MPYHVTPTKGIPQKLRGILPEHAQKIYLGAYNNAFDEYQDPEKRRGKNKEPPEKVAHKVAWAAVKKKYKKVNDNDGWVEK